MWRSELFPCYTRALCPVSSSRIRSRSQYPGTSATRIKVPAQFLSMELYLQLMSSVGEDGEDGEDDHDHDGRKARVDKCHHLE